MFAAYGLDILRPEVTPRRVWVLLCGLPPQFRRGGEAWSTEAELLAGLIDRVAELTYVTLRLNGAKGAKRPRPVPRPPRPMAAVSRQSRVYPKRALAAAGRNDPAEPSGPVKTGSWAEAIEMIAGMRNVRVRHAP
jgi:hypothetical protein